jgi:hypothetical protein
MRIALLAAAGLFVACTNPQPPPPDRAAIDADTQALLKPVPEARQRGPLSGFVSARDQNMLSLDSGGQHLVPLRVNDRTPTMRDGQRGTAADIREGDVVRAAYSMGPDGTPQATELVVNSKPVSGRATPPGTNAVQPSEEQLQPTSSVQPPQQPGDMPVLMEVTPVETRKSPPPVTQTNGSEPSPKSQTSTSGQPSSGSPPSSATPPSSGTQPSPR